MIEVAAEPVPLDLGAFVNAMTPSARGGVRTDRGS